MNDNFTTVLFWKSYVLMTLILNYLKKIIFRISEQQLLSYSVYPRDVTIFIIN